MKFYHLISCLALVVSASALDGAPPQAGLLTPDQQAQVTQGGQKFEYQVSSNGTRRAGEEGETDEPVSSRSRTLLVS